MNKYLPRLVDDEIEVLKQIMGAILIEGCKWCGKSTTASKHSKSIVYFQNPDKKSEYDSIKNTKPSLFLNGEKPRMFDEWQMYPVVWDSIRSDIDINNLKGQYILTGSVKVKKDEIMHTGTGRIAKIKMRPMSMYESKESDGKVSIKDLFEGKEIEAVNSMTIEKLAEIIVKGGWPSTIEIKGEAKFKIAKEYVKSLIEEDIISEGQKRTKDISKMTAVLRSLSRNIGTNVSNQTIVKDVENIFDEGISRPTLNEYIGTLEDLFILENIYATNLNFRSKIAIRTKPKKIFVDPSIATAVLDLTPTDLINDLNFFGFLFENLCIRDLLIYQENKGSEIAFYRDENNFEVDAIIRQNSGKWGAVEIKLGTGYVEESAKNLLKFKETVDIQKCGEPSFLMVLTGGNYSYKRDDGVYVVSIASLRD